MTNPYIAGNPVGGSPAFVGRETVLRSVLRMLESPGENAIVLFGQRRIGKTSVLQELAQRLRSAGPYHPLYFDLQDKAALPLAQVVTELAQRLAAELRLPPPPDWGASAPEAFRQKYLPYALEELPNDHSLVLLFDEFDVLDSPAKNQAGAAFFPYLRDLLTASPRLQFVFVIGRRPEDLSSLTLSVFKGVRSELISLLTPEETTQLVRLAEADGSLSWSEAAVVAVNAVTGGHPFLTQQLCQEVWEQAHEADTAETRPPVTPAGVESVVPATLRSATNALEWLWSGLGPAERIVASALAGAGPGAITQEELERRLQESGVRILIGELRDAPRTLQDWDLIEPNSGGYRFRVELLRRWIAERKPLSRVQEEIDYIQPVAENLFQAAYGLYQDKDTNRLAEALPLLQQVVRLNPNHQRGTLLLAEILLAQNRLDEARQLLENLYQSSPAVARPRLVQTLLLQAQANVPEDKQLELYDRVLALEQGQPEALAGQRRIWEQRGDKTMAAGNALAAMQAYKQSGTRDKFLEAALRYVVNLEREEKFEAALEQAKFLWKSFPNEKARLPDLDLLQRKTQLSGLYSQGLAALEAGKKDEAAKLLAQVVSLNPSYREATRYLQLAVTGEDVATLRTQLRQEVELHEVAVTRLKQIERQSILKRRPWIFIVVGIVVIGILAFAISRIILSTVEPGDRDARLTLVAMQSQTVTPTPFVPSTPTPTATATPTPTHTATPTFTPTATPTVFVPPSHVCAMRLFAKAGLEAQLAVPGNQAVVGQETRLAAQAATWPGLRLSSSSTVDCGADKLQQIVAYVYRLASGPAAQAAPIQPLAGSRPELKDADGGVLTLAQAFVIAKPTGDLPAAAVTYTLQYSSTAGWQPVYDFAGDAPDQPLVLTLRWDAIQVVTPTPTFTPRPTPTVTPTPRWTATPQFPRVSGLESSDSPKSSDFMIFKWQATGPLPEGYCYEVVFWAEGQNPAEAFGLMDVTAEGGCTLPPRPINLNNDMTLSGKTYNWAVNIVQKSPYVQVTKPGDVEHSTVIGKGIQRSPMRPPK